SRRRHTRFSRDWSSDVCSSDLLERINWVGFYLMEEGELVLGPFQGLPACVRIPVGKGVCGTAVADKKTMLVEDVHAFPGHIACEIGRASCRERGSISVGAMSLR